jgi:hypothetical protein
MLVHVVIREADLPGANARHIEEIFDEAGQRLGVPIHCGAGLRQTGLDMTSGTAKHAPPAYEPAVSER